MDEKNPLLRVAVISDSQAYPTLHDWGMSNLEKAFQLLAPMKPDVLLMAGDLADHAILDVYDLYRERMETYFSPIPVHVGCAGNHDYWVYAGEDRNPEYIYSEMSRRIGQKMPIRCGKLSADMILLLFPKILMGKMVILLRCSMLWKKKFRQLLPEIIANRFLLLLIFIHLIR